MGSGGGEGRTNGDRGGMKCGCQERKDKKKRQRKGRKMRTEERRNERTRGG